MLETQVRNFPAKLRRLLTGHSIVEALVRVDEQLPNMLLMLVLLSFLYLASPVAFRY